MRRSDGFTLIETVVALLIVSLGMTAVYMQLNQFATNSIYMQEKTIAGWIASNRLTELSIASEWPEIGDDEEELEYAGRLWQLQIEIAATDVDNLRRAEVAVSLADRPERVLHTVAALIEPPVPVGIAPVSWRSVGGARR
ncbi:MAG: type II secretion system minor pseudopilin GspI [Gammaproteobacteria bacterium]|nr:type II secretion system minor pseudopilin GspI [Gammaproteobacteria bacterium]